MVPPFSTSGGNTILTRLPSGESRIDHWARLVDATADPAGDALRYVDEMLGITKPRSRLFELAASFDVDVEWSICQDVSDFVVIEERLERSQTDHVVAEVGGERGFLEFVELNPVLGRDLADQLGDFAPQSRAGNETGDGRVDSGHQNRPDLLLQLPEQGRIGHRY
jgi:hypothetical protein